MCNYRNEFNNLKWAKRELDLVYKSPEDDFIKQDVMELLETFSNQGQSGYSASFISNIFNKLARHELLSPLDYNEDDFVSLKEYGDPTGYQNKRLSSVFKNDVGCYYLDGIRFVDEYDISFTGSIINEHNERIKSSQYIKSFPFIPKTFTINVKEVDSNSNTYTILNPEVLVEAFNYYERKYNNVGE